MVGNLYILVGEILSKIYVHVKSYKYEVCLLDANNKLGQSKFTVKVVTYCGLTSDILSG